MSIPVDMPAGNTVYCDSTQIKLISESPKELTHEGWIYKKDRPVVAEWIKDGVWCVDKHSGEKYQIIGGDPASYRLKRSAGMIDRSPEWISVDCRPHESSDWKWGDWAMYDGKRVFVVGKVGWEGDIYVSHPIFCDGYGCLPVSTITPTF